MAWEWVAPVTGSVATVAVGVAGIVATYKAGSRQQETALLVAQQQADAQVAVAREERQQRRLEEAYLEMLAALRLVHYWVFTVYPVITSGDKFTMPPLPELEDHKRKEALWSAYWSPKVERLMGEWETAVRELQQLGATIGIARSTEASGQQTGIDLTAAFLELPGRKQKVIEADRQVREQVRLELRGESDGHTEKMSNDSAPSETETA